MLDGSHKSEAIEIWQGALRLYTSRERPPRHQCHIYEGPPSQTLPIMAAIIAQKLTEHNRCMYLNSPPMISGLKFYLTSAGVNLNEHMERGSLVLSSEREHLVGGSFRSDLMLDMLEIAIEEALRDGYQGLWATGDMTWELGPQQSVADLLDYEWRLERIFQDRPALSGVCQYHADTLPKYLVRQGFVAHSAIFVNETLSRLNPHYLPPGSASPVPPELDRLIARIAQDGRLQEKPGQ